MNQVVQYRPLLQAQRLRHRQDALHKTATRLTVATERPLPPQHPRTQQTLDVVVGRLYPTLIHKGPQRRLQLQQVPAKAGRLFLRARRTVFQPVTHALTDRLQLELQLLPTPAATEQVPLMKQDVDRGQTLFAVLPAQATAVHQLLEIPLQVRPANLTAPQQQPLICRPAIRADQTANLRAEQGQQALRAAAGMDDKVGH